MTEWQRDMARTLVKMFEETYRTVHRGSETGKHRAKMRMFEIHSAMTHLLDDLAEGRERERIFVGINVPEPAAESETEVSR